MLRNILKMVQFISVANNNCIFEKYKIKHHTQVQEAVHILLFCFLYGIIH